MCGQLGEHSSTRRLWAYDLLVWSGCQVDASCVHWRLHTVCATSICIAAVMYAFTQALRRLSVHKRLLVYVYQTFVYGTATLLNSSVANLLLLLLLLTHEPRPSLWACSSGLDKPP